MRRGPLLLVQILGCSGSAPADPDGSSESGVECGSLDCRDGVRLSLVAQAGTFAAGAYTVALGAPGLAMACELEIADDMATCAGEVSCVASTNCDAEFDAQFSLTPPPSYGVFFVAGSGELQVVVTRDNATLVDEVIAPDYVEVAPNGNDCPPVCLVADAQVMVP